MDNKNGASVATISIFRLFGCLHFDWRLIRQKGLKRGQLGTALLSPNAS